MNHKFAIKYGFPATINECNLYIKRSEYNLTYQKNPIIDYNSHEVKKFKIKYENPVLT